MGVEEHGGTVRARDGLSGTLARSDDKDGVL